MGSVSASGGRGLERALTAALGALSRRERTIEELRAWLLDRDLPVEVVEEAVEQLIELGELDDERFAHAFAADKRDLAGWGPERIAEALEGRGLDRDLVERACGEEREEQLRRAVEQLAQRGYDLGDERGRARALAHLGRRGYELELAYDAVRVAERELRPAA